MSTLHAPGVVGLVRLCLHATPLLGLALAASSILHLAPRRQLKKAHPDCFIAADSSKAACEAAA